MQHFILYSIHDISVLTTLQVAYVYDIQWIVNTLMKLPPLLQFSVNSTRKITLNDVTVSSRSLIRLFQRYGIAAEKSQSVLTYILLQDCNEVSDDLLTTLTTIKPLREIALHSLINISTSGINNVIIKLFKQLTSVQLVDMDSVTDSIILALGDFKELTRLKLHN